LILATTQWPGSCAGYGVTLNRWYAAMEGEYANSRASIYYASIYYKSKAKPSAAPSSWPGMPLGLGFWVAG
jgi:hypothetical protein